MKKKKKEQEQAEIKNAVRTLCSAVRAIASKKAYEYEIQILQQVRDDIDEEIAIKRELNGFVAERTGCAVEKQIKIE